MFFLLILSGRVSGASVSDSLCAVPEYRDLASGLNIIVRSAPVPVADVPAHDNLASWGPRCLFCCDECPCDRSARTRELDTRQTTEQHDGPRDKDVCTLQQGDGGVLYSTSVLFM